MAEPWIWLAAGLGLMLALRACVLPRHGLRRTLTRMITGAAALAAAQAAAPILGFSLGINAITALTAAGLGAPGVALLCLLRQTLPG